ncbi:MAG: helix-turn-helix transcriptional regulator [Gemmatimonas sp.]|jgi:transcriptional regulator with XRE-family HTH domain|uniref:helix-turn-helix transcriptional regulator n=2 Tax=Gemmatimonas sp. TaxID=1962908 RepID=UPI0022CC4D2E|nr:helix-turn-helix domain-containing protein [Gemmatimonas sp.]MCZ8012027.1 helix-turn-helix domain-containing protein [Gemmatimonas sp.]MCZ8267347.1 helix-turn-helix domain-containing protein [Gemmatimonas sp.]
MAKAKPPAPSHVGPSPAVRARKSRRGGPNAGRGGESGRAFRAQLQVLIARAGSQERLARQCGLSLQTVNDWKNGKSLPGFEQLLKLSDSMGVTLDWLCRGLGPESPTISRSQESLEVDLSRYVVEAVAREEGLPVASAHVDLRIDAQWLLQTVTARVLERFRSTRKQFVADADREVRSLQAMNYLEDLSYFLATQTRDRPLREQAIGALLRLGEDLLRGIPDVDDKYSQEPGVWFKRSRTAYEVLLPSAEAVLQAFSVAHEKDPVVESLRRLSRARPNSKRGVVGS